MSQRVVINGKGQVRCRLDEGSNSMLWIYNRQGRALGYYHQVNDKTYAVGGKYIGPGDQRMILAED